MPSDAVVFFDGVCGLCNSTVDFLLRIDTKKRLRFSPLQGDLASRLGINPPAGESPRNIVFWDGEDLFHESKAVIQILRRVGGFWQLAGGGMALFPRALRDAIYRGIARHRYEWFGKRETCRLPTAGEADRFIR